MPRYAATTIRETQALGLPLLPLLYEGAPRGS